jgi:hypothetical protein
LNRVLKAAAVATALHSGFAAKWKLTRAQDRRRAASLHPLPGLDFAGTLAQRIEGRVVLSALIARLDSGNVTHPKAPFLDDHDGSALEESENPGKDKRQPVDHVMRGCIPRSKDDCADVWPGRKRDDLAEVDIECNDDRSLCSCFLEDLSVRKPLQLLIAKVFYIVAGLPTRMVY